MPEKGWKTLTVRTPTHELIVRKAKKEKLTPDEWLTVKLKEGFGDRVSKGKDQGGQPSKVAIKPVDRQAAEEAAKFPDLDKLKKNVE
jgi:hypothetical protein